MELYDPFTQYFAAGRSCALELHRDDLPRGPVRHRSPRNFNPYQRIYNLEPDGIPLSYGYSGDGDFRPRILPCNAHAAPVNIDLPCDIFFKNVHYILFIKISVRKKVLVNEQTFYHLHGIRIALDHSDMG